MALLGEITVKAIKTEEIGTGSVKIQIKVIDTGSGIAPEVKDRLFKYPFVKVEEEQVCNAFGDTVKQSGSDEDEDHGFDKWMGASTSAEDPTCGLGCFNIRCQA
jgi:hypothetical protein